MNNQQVRRIVIAGAGQAGASAALALRRAGFDGDITLVGDEPHVPYERPQLSKEMLRPGDATLRPMRTADDYARDGIGLRLGRKVARVEAGARRVELDDGQWLDYDRLLIATGVRPRRIAGLTDPTRVRHLRNVEDAIALRQDIVDGCALAIVGGGVIGLEVAAAARPRGNTVVIVEAADRLMSRCVDPVISRFLDRRHRAEGSDIRYGVQAQSFDGTNLALSDGSTIAADRVLVGVGVVPNSEAFDALGIGDGIGIRVDHQGRTAIDGIYATGDIASQPGAHDYGRVETWANAQGHAAAVAQNLLGADAECAVPMWFWSDQGSTNLQVLDDAPGGDVVMRGDPEGDVFSAFRLNGDACVVACSAVNSPKDMAMARRWLAQRQRLDPTRLADAAIPLRDCLA